MLLHHRMYMEEWEWIISFCFLTTLTSWSWISVIIWILWQRQYYNKFPNLFHITPPGQTEKLIFLALLKLDRDIPSLFLPFFPSSLHSSLLSSFLLSCDQWWKLSSYGRVTILKLPHGRQLSWRAANVFCRFCMSEK